MAPEVTEPKPERKPPKLDELLDFLNVEMNVILPCRDSEESVHTSKGHLAVLFLLIHQQFLSLGG
jgi:hypothetical protein